MPKQKITKEMIVEAAFEIARNGGMEQVMVKNIADKLHCSVQPIYSYCKNMEGLRNDVIERVKQFVNDYAIEHIDKNNLFRSTGSMYVQLAKEEPNIFKMYILHERIGIASLSDLYASETNPNVADFIAEKLNISVENARQLHLNMLIYTVGIGTIYSISIPGISTDEILEQQGFAYQAFLKHILEGDD